MAAILVLGGARSGKSARALTLAADAAERVFIATAEPLDPEMAARIVRHRRDRGGTFRTVEAPMDLPAALHAATGPGRAVVVDCLTLWLSNLMHRNRRLAPEFADLCVAVSVAGGTLVLVSNEVGSGVCPANRLVREFRDAHGRLNQLAAAVCDRVERVIAGLPQVIKASPGADHVLDRPAARIGRRVERLGARIAATGRSGRLRNLLRGPGFRFHLAGLVDGAWPVALMDRTLVVLTRRASRPPTFEASRHCSTGANGNGSLERLSCGTGSGRRPSRRRAACSTS